MLKGLHHVAIICSSYKTSKHFYTQVLGLKVIDEHFRKDRDSYKLDLALPDGCQIELFSFPNRPPRPSYPEALGLRHLAFCVDDINAVVAHLTKQGVNVEAIRIDPYTHKRFTFLADPDDLPIELYEY